MDFFLKERKLRLSFVQTNTTVPKGGYPGFVQWQYLIHFIIYSLWIILTAPLLHWVTSGRIIFKTVHSPSTAYCHFRSNHIQNSPQ